MLKLVSHSDTITRSRVSSTNCTRRCGAISALYFDTPTHLRRYPDRRSCTTTDGDETRRQVLFPWKKPIGNTFSGCFLEKHQRNSNRAYQKRKARSLFPCCFQKKQPQNVFLQWCFPGEQVWAPAVKQQSVFDQNDYEFTDGITIFPRVDETR